MPSFHFPRPTLSQAVLLGLIVFSCTVDATRSISILGVSGVGMGTFAGFGAVWVAWLSRPALPRGVLVVLLPLMLFIIDVLGTLFWYRPGGMDGVQMVTVFLTFIGTIMVTARETRTDPDCAKSLHRAILYTSIFPVMICFLAIVTHRIPESELNVTRPFALYTLCTVAVALAAWLAPNRPAPRGQQRQSIRWATFVPLGWVLFVAYVVLLGLSRTALVGILLMIPLSVALRGNFKSALMSVVILAIGAAGFITILYNNHNLYNRFFHEDAHMQVGGIAINGTGRSQIWKILLDNIGDDWMFGKGVSASEDIIKHVLPNVGQPHNDYLRIYYDEGMVGLCIWLIFLISMINRSAVNLRKSVRNQTDDYPMHLAALLALAGVLFSMLTDNSIIYPPVMIPLAIVLGCSLGKDASVDESPAVDETFEQTALGAEGKSWAAR